ncbi:hypothetical protein RvY_13020 [Ramazzottius varieornatus]|uniref:Serine/threonine-protein kinase 11-interacting protein n=1 Tax=Ramazzottius varieornatus TaxID=947166 RepID=A0A1D1VLI2_RAMVA|nr:hypothetical protein RvY_13020 [Ramazzottius varieornatus]
MAFPMGTLVALVRKIEPELFNGQFTLTLTSPVLARLARDVANPPNVESPQDSSIIDSKKHDQLKAYLADLRYLGHVIDGVSSLCIIHEDGTLHGTISLSLFQSLRYLEIRRLPLHLLKGLTNLRGQLETVICKRSLQDVSLLLRKCGGDASSSSLWPELKTLICNDCDIDVVGTSLELAPSLQNVDFSRNTIVDCRDAYLKLDELKFVNLGYNTLSKVPQFSPTTRRNLKILILRNNCLQTLEGLEDLESLRELDVSFNGIADHKLLWPLQPLSKLTRLDLAGNPVTYHKRHRSILLTYLHPAAIKNPRLLLDAVGISKSELRKVPETLGNLLPTLRPVPVRQRTALTLETVGNEDQDPVSDLSTSTSSVGSASRTRGQRRFRTVQLDEPEEEKTRPTKPVSTVSSSVSFAVDIEERRHKFGDEWLRFQSVEDAGISSSIPIEIAAFPKVESPIPFLLNEDAKEASRHDEELRRAESIEAAERTESNENESEPFFVHFDTDMSPEHLLIVSVGEVHLIERNAAGVITEMLELSSMMKCEAEEGSVVAMYFDYLRKDRRRRRYVLEDPEQASQLLQLLQPIVSQKAENAPMFQCLQCSEVFPEYRAETKVKYVPHGDFQHNGYSSSIGCAISLSVKGTMNEVAVCPFCASEMLVQHKSASSSKSVTPEDEGSPSSETLSPTSSNLSSRPSCAVAMRRTNSVVLLADEPSFSEETILPPSSFHSPMVSSSESVLADLTRDSYGREDSSEETLFSVQNIESTVALLESSAKNLPKDALTWDFEEYKVLDHRLRLHIDMNILTTPDENFMMAAKVEVVLSKRDVGLERVLIISNLRIYTEYIEGDIDQDPVHWLHRENTVRLDQVNLLHQVIDGESLRLGFTDGTFWLLLFRDRQRTSNFVKQIENVLTSNKLSFLEDETTEHSQLESWLNANLTDVPEGSSATISSRTMCYLGRSPVTLITTHTHLLILNETYKALAESGKSSVALIDSRPLSSVSCLVANLQKPTTIGLKFFEENPDYINQWDFQYETVDGLRVLVEAVRQPWEQTFFHVPLNFELYTK